MNKIKNFPEYLEDVNACEDAKKWIGKRTPKQTWDECPRGDWLLWWCQKEKVSLQLLTLAKGKCAGTVIHLMKDQHSKDAVKAAIDFGNGLIAREELDAASAYAAAAYAAAYDAAGVLKNARINQKITADTVRSIITPTWI